jgi:hypothetical protein
MKKDEKVIDAITYIIGKLMYERKCEISIWVEVI